VPSRAALGRTKIGACRAPICENPKVIGLRMGTQPWTSEEGIQDEEEPRACSDEDYIGYSCMIASSLFGA
jgi:hypothetical protein